MWTEIILKTIDSFKKEMNEMENNKKLFTIALDFDGTVVKHEYPYIGEENKPCVDVLKRWIEDFNIGIILDTMRSGKELEEALKWFEERDIPLYGVGKHPTQHKWTKSPKAYAQFSIDDRNLGCPLKVDKNGKRPYVDWKEIDNMLTPLLEKLIE